LWADSLDFAADATLAAVADDASASGVLMIGRAVFIPRTSVDQIVCRLDACPVVLLT